MMDITETQIHGAFEALIQARFAPEGDARERFMAYSGRGMYGETCFAFVGDLQEYTEWLLSLNSQAWEFGSSDATDLLLAFNEVRVSTDSMGLDMVFYWADLTVTPHELDRILDIAVAQR